LISDLPKPLKRLQGDHTKKLPGKRHRYNALTSSSRQPIAFPIVYQGICDHDLNPFQKADSKNLNDTVGEAFAAAPAGEECG